MLKQIIIPKSITTKVYLSLIFTIAIFGGILFVIYYFLGIWGLLGLGILPIIIILLIPNKNNPTLLSDIENKEIYSFVETIANKIGVECPNKIYITPTSEIGVSGIFNKKLFIGIVTLRNLNKSEFKAIIAHELGHLSGNDTIIGGIIYRLNHSINLITHVGVKWYDSIPIMNFAIFGMILAVVFSIFGVIYNLICMLYSRLVEYRADYVAATIAGENNFKSGLIKYSGYTIYFDSKAQNEIIDLLSEGKAFLNIYVIAENGFENIDKEELYKNILELEKKSFFDSHPTLKERINNLPEILKPINSQRAITLFKNIIDLEKDMTDQLTKQVHGLVLKAIKEREEELE